MVGEFDSALARQMQQLLAQVERTTQQTGQTITGESLSASDVLAVLGENDDWVDAFEQRIERQFDMLADRVVEKWMRNVDSEIRQSLKALAETAVSIFATDGSANAAAQDIEDIFAEGGNISRRLQGVVARSASNLIENVLTVSRTHSQESERSREATQRYKASRGQVNAELSRELAKGKRYQ